MRHSTWRTVRRRLDGDGGFSLTEAMVAAFVLALFAAGIAGLIMSSLKVSKIDRQRVGASSLAAREMEIVRDQFARSDAAALAVVQQGVVVDPHPLAGPTPNTLDGVRYTVRRTASWSPAGTGVSACEGGGAVTYPNVRINVAVTWPGMGSVQPVTSDSIVTPSKKLINSSYAFVAVKVVDVDNQPSAGRTVTVSGPSTMTQITDVSGCAVFGLPTAGAYTFRAEEPGFVNSAGASFSAQAVTVAAGSFQKIQFVSDEQATLQVALQTQAGHGWPAPLPPIVVANPAMPAPGYALANAVSPPAATTVSQLWPHTNGYTVWAGGCADANPASSPTNGSTAVTAVTPGGTQAVIAPLAPVEVRVPASGVDVEGNPVFTPVSVTATHTAGCSETYSLGYTDSSGVLRTSLPYGSWTVTAGGHAPVAVIPAASGTTTVDVL